MTSTKRKAPSIQRHSELRETLTPKGSTAITGFGLSYTYRLLRRGVIPSIQVGNRHFIPRSALLRWLDACGEPTTAPKITT